MRRRCTIGWLLGSSLFIIWLHTACEPTSTQEQGREQQRREQGLQEQLPQEQPPQERPTSTEAGTTESDGGASDALPRCVCEPDEVCLHITGGACRPLDAGESCGQDEILGPSPSLPPCCLRDSYHCWIPPIECNDDKTCGCFLAKGIKDIFPECETCTQGGSARHFRCPVP